MTGPAAYAPVLVQRALALGACSPEAEARAGKASSSNSSSIKGVDVVQAPPAVADPAPSVWKPVSPTSSAAQASAIRAEVASRKRDRKDISSSDAIKEASARGEATTGDAIAGEKRRAALEELLQEIPSYAILAFLGGKSQKNGPFKPIALDALEKMHPGRVLDQLERIGCANNWTAKKVHAMKNELVRLKVWCEERDLWEDGKLTCLVTSEYLQVRNDEVVSKHAISAGQRVRRTERRGNSLERRTDSPPHS